MEAPGCGCNKSQFIGGSLECQCRLLPRLAAKGSFKEVLDRRLATPWGSPTPDERLPSAEREARDLALQRAKKAKKARENAAAAADVARQFRAGVGYIAEAQYGAMRVQRVTKEVTG